MRATIMYGPGDVQVEKISDPKIIELGRVFDSVINIDGVPEGYRAMDDRKAIKVMIEF